MVVNLLKASENVRLIGKRKKKKKTSPKGHNHVYHRNNLKSHFKKSFINKHMQIKITGSKLFS